MDQYAVMGNPIQHSQSPLIHRLFAQQTQQMLHYSSLLVDIDGLSIALDQFQSRGGKGVNITLPFKHRAFELVNDLSERAKRAEAINTIKFHEDGTRFGDNTDGIGLVKDITLNHKISLQHKNILLLGAGGAVRGVLEAILAEKPFQITISNRTESKSMALAEAFANLGMVQACPLQELGSNSFDIVVNGTSASLQGELLDLPRGILRQNAFCYDMVYGKKTTPFLNWAKSQGAAICADGLGMLVEQASEAFFIWRNIRPDTRPVLSFLKSAGSEE